MHLDDFEFIGNAVQFAPDLIDLPQRELVFIRRLLHSADLLT